MLTLLNWAGVEELTEIPSAQSVDEESSDDTTRQSNCRKQ
jgi:hypothetical protein